MFYYLLLFTLCLWYLCALRQGFEWHMFFEAVNSMAVFCISLWQLFCASVLVKYHHLHTLCFYLLKNSTWLLGLVHLRSLSTWGSCEYIGSKFYLWLLVWQLKYTWNRDVHSHKMMQTFIKLFWQSHKILSTLLTLT